LQKQKRSRVQAAGAAGNFHAFPFRLLKGSIRSASLPRRRLQPKRRLQKKRAAFSPSRGLCWSRSGESSALFRRSFFSAAEKQGELYFSTVRLPR
jgi:hypothetical protein